ncbi:hypothetical protein GEMRC1_010054 [Eukaryota sp. GEM-RC1]
MMFTIGLLTFLAGHVMYTLAFSKFGSTGSLFYISAGGSLLVSTGLFIWLQPHVGEMLVPVVAYLVVITIMVSSAGALGSSTKNGTARFLVICGAVMFYISDIFVARDQFVEKTYVNRVPGLPFYYSARFMIAFSIGRLTETGNNLLLVHVNNLYPFLD